MINFSCCCKRDMNHNTPRNALQLNNGDGTFSDIAFLSGVSSTDWSWASLFADYDNDGDKDLMVTNGFYRDLGDQDYINYQKDFITRWASQMCKEGRKIKSSKSIGQCSFAGLFI